MNKLPEELIFLHNSYLGDESWIRYVNSLSFNPPKDFSWSDSEIPEDIAFVLICKVGPLEHSKKWLNTNIPALEGYKPLDVLSNYDSGEEVLRALLMRMP